MPQKRIGFVLRSAIHTYLNNTLKLSFMARSWTENCPKKILPLHDVWAITVVDWKWCMFTWRRGLFLEAKSVLANIKASDIGLESWRGIKRWWSFLWEQDETSWWMINAWINYGVIIQLFSGALTHFSITHVTHLLKSWARGFWVQKMY